jgi:hypothetical protein
MNIVVNSLLVFWITSYVLHAQVFKEATTYRSKMKDYCRKMFLWYYSEALGLDNIEFENQQGYEGNIADNVKKLIGTESLFHYGPVDSVVSFS